MRIVLQTEAGVLSIHVWKYMNELRDIIAILFRLRWHLLAFRSPCGEKFAKRRKDILDHGRVALVVLLRTDPSASGLHLDDAVVRRTSRFRHFRGISEINLSTRFKAGN